MIEFTKLYLMFVCVLSLGIACGTTEMVRSNVSSADTTTMDEDDARDIAVDSTPLSEDIQPINDVMIDSFDDINLSDDIDSSNDIDVSDDIDASDILSCLRFINNISVIDTVVGRTSQTTAQVHNSCDYAVQLVDIQLTSENSIFIISQAPSLHTLQPFESIDVIISFSPTEEGAFVAALTMLWELGEVSSLVNITIHARSVPNQCPVVDLRCRVEGETEYVTERICAINLDRIECTGEHSWDEDGFVVDFNWKIWGPIEDEPPLLYLSRPDEIFFHAYYGGIYEVGLSIVDDLEYESCEPAILEVWVMGMCD